MKKRNLFITLGLALGLGVGVFAGLKAGQEVKEVKASTTTYYLTGSFNGWSTDLAKCYPFEAHNASEVKILGHSFTGNNTFKAIYAVDGVYAGYAGNINSKGDGDNSINSRSGINVYAYETNAGIHYNNDSSTNYFNIYFNHTNAHFYVDYAYKLTVGGNDYWMERNGSGEQYKKTVTVAVNDEISVTSFSGSADTVNPEAKASNNLTSSRRIKIAGEQDIYWGSTDKTAWVSGYSPIGMEDADLQNFCDALLALDCSATDFTSCGWSGLDVDEKAAFNDATVTLGNGVSYSTFGNVVNEAATRYVRLLNNAGATPLDGVTVSAGVANYAPVTTTASSNNNVVLIVAIVAGAALLAVGGYFVIRNRKED